MRVAGCEPPRFARAACCFAAPYAAAAARPGASAPRASARRPAAAAVALAAAACVLLAPGGAAPRCEAALIQRAPCYKGDGPGCDAAAADNALIHKLLEQSRANRALNDNAVLERYWKQGYGDYFSYGFNKRLVRDADGKWSLVDPDGLPARIQRSLHGLLKRPK